LSKSLKTELYKCVPGDEQRIVDLADQIWKPTFREILTEDRLNYLFNFMYHPDKLKSQLLSDAQQFYFLTENNRDIGYSHLVFHPDFTKLEKIYLHKDFQGQGFGLYLLGQMISKATEKQNLPVQLQVNRGNRKAIDFYLKFGFEIKEARDFEVGDGHIMDDYIMVYHRIEHEVL
jgi:ribosomal protein S18 acetylase RimI-like enzyme